MHFHYISSFGRVNGIVGERFVRVFRITKPIFKLGTGSIRIHKKPCATDLLDCLDLPLISPDFSPDLFQERLALMRLAAQIDDRIEPHPFTPQDFNASDPLSSEIRKTGVRVA